MHDIQTRRDLTELVPKDAIGVEVGVKQASFSLHLLKFSPFKRLYSVDNWGGLATSAHKRNYLVAAVHLAEFKTRSVMIKLDSTEAAELFQDKTFDFVYIDADHSYEAVRNDIQAWWPKTKPGGVFSGHDYCQKCPGVPKAVDEFVMEKGLEVRITDEHLPSWYLIKPC